MAVNYRPKSSYIQILKRIFESLIGKKIIRTATIDEVIQGYRAANHPVAQEHHVSTPQTASVQPQEPTALPARTRSNEAKEAPAASTSPRRGHR